MRLAALIPAVALALLATEARAQTPNGEALFALHCAACHVNPTDEKAPTRAALATLSPNAIVDALTDGTMRIQGQPLSAAERTAIAERLTGRPLLAASRSTGGGMCEAAAQFSMTRVE